MSYQEKVVRCLVCSKAFVTGKRGLSTHYQRSDYCRTVLDESDESEEEEEAEEAEEEHEEEEPEECEEEEEEDDAQDDVVEDAPLSESANFE